MDWLHGTETEATCSQCYESLRAHSTEYESTAVRYMCGISVGMGDGILFGITHTRCLFQIDERFVHVEAFQVDRPVVPLCKLPPACDQHVPVLRPLRRTVADNRWVFKVVKHYQPRTAVACTTSRRQRSND